MKALGGAFHAMPGVLLFTAAGACAYLFLLNRLLIQMRDARHKSYLVRAGGILSVVVSGGVGYLAAGRGWMIPAAVLGAVALGEVGRLVARWHHRGTAPVAEDGAPISLKRPRTTTDLVVRRYVVTAPAWRGPALRIAHVSDFHLNSHLPLAYYEGVMRRVTDAQPDLIFFTGDFITCAEHANQLPGLLSLAKGRLGTFGILGNHDYWADPVAVTEAVIAAGVSLLGDGGTRISVDGHHSVWVAGCELPWSRQALLPQQASKPRPPAAGELGLLLTHTPDNIYSLRGLGYTAIFAGHYHAGQMRVPGLGALVVPSNYGRRFDHGHFVFGATHLFVTAGVGSAEPPVRIWCQPDVFIVDVTGEPA